MARVAFAITASPENFAPGLATSIPRCLAPGLKGHERDEGERTVPPRACRPVSSGTINCDSPWLGCPKRAVAAADRVIGVLPAVTG